MNRDLIIINIQGSEYTVVDGDDNVLVHFFDNTVSYGGISVIADRDLSLDEIKITSLPVP